MVGVLYVYTALRQWAREAESGSCWKPAVSGTHTEILTEEGSVTVCQWFQRGTGQWRTTHWLFRLLPVPHVATSNSQGDTRVQSSCLHRSRRNRTAMITITSDIIRKIKKLKLLCLMHVTHFYFIWFTVTLPQKSKLIFFGHISK